jgi:hypothetical protein
MPQKPPGLLQLSDARNYNDGTVSFTVDRQDGKRFAVSCSIQELADIINYLFALARAVTEGEGTELTPGPRSVAPIPVDGIGIAIAPDPDQTILVVKIGGFDLDLSVPNSGLAKFGHDLARTVTTLSASSERKN